MKICIVNITPIPTPYWPASVEAIEACTRQVLRPETQLELRAPSRGTITTPEHLTDFRNRYFAHKVKQEVIECILAADSDGFDAIIVNCFDDPGVLEARSVIKTPVFGLSEITFHHACLLGEKFGALVPNMPGQVKFVRQQIEQMGLQSRLVANGVRGESIPFSESYTEALTNPDSMIKRLSQQGEALVSTGADVVVIACGGLGQFCGMAKFHEFTMEGASVPVVVPLTVTCKYVEMMLELSQGLSTNIYSQAHGGKPFSPNDFQRVTSAFQEQ